MMHKQSGATFFAWMSSAGIIIFTLVTVVKLVPSYLEFYAVRDLANEIAATSTMKSASKQQIKQKVDDYLNINGLYTLTSEAFDVVQVEGKKNVRALVVDYEARRNWFANIDFLMKFHHSVELGKVGDT